MFEGKAKPTKSGAVKAWNSLQHWSHSQAFKRRKDAQHNDTKHDGTQHNDTQHNDTQHNDTWYSDTQHDDT